MLTKVEPPRFVGNLILPCLIVAIAAGIAIAIPAAIAILLPWGVGITASSILITEHENHE